MEQQRQSPSLEDCLKLLKGERDEQRLAGLLLVTKFCNKDDYASIRRVYDAVGVRFLDRLLRTGMGKLGVIESGGDNHDAYLQLSITVLAAFCRVPEIASSEDMASKIPLILEIMSNGLGSSVTEECYEFLFLVSNTHKDGVSTLYESGGMSVLASQMSTFPDGSHSVQYAMRLVQLMINKLSLDTINNEHPSELALMVATIAKQFAVLHDAVKFEALHLLVAILSSRYSAALHEALRLMKDDIWLTFIRVGVMAILQNRVAPAEKLQALVLAESTISIVGEGWLIGQMNLSDTQDLVPADRCILLVLESSRVEVAVLLNELAYLKYEASKNSSSNSESILLKKQNLVVAFSLVERIIKLISNIGGDDEGSVISESTLTKVISGLNETIGVILEYLEDAKDHGQTKGDDLLASVRVVGSYLAETPVACKEKVRELLGYMLSIEGEDEPSPFYSICFLLPMLCQITMEVYGCKVLASSGAYKAVVECLIKLIGPDGHTNDDNGSIFLACDTIMNLLLKRDQIRVQLDDAYFVRLLRALVYWTGDTDDLSVIMMASSICTLIFDSTSEEALLQHPSFDRSDLISLSQLIVRSLAICGQEMMSDDAKAEADLHQIVASGYSRWADRFPHIREAVER
ncbi:Neurochondrin [Camellia lanceoleosa]|uniref:Neurochondrin n=1 Tax=Camellia lanceoleosa TaxID=1840588 RepID=A0ACC0FGV8_9ERIC|nr:Neurochondrin [Camellia lanceoleosa]